MKCEYCGSDMPNDLKNCPTCGGPVAEVKEVVAPVVENTIVNNPTPATAPTTPGIDASTLIPTEKSKGSNTGFIVIVALLVVIIIVLGIFISNGSNKDEGSDDTTKTTEKTTTTTTSTTTSTTTRSFTTTTTTAIAQLDNYVTVYGYKFLVPSGFQSKIDQDIIYVYNTAAKKQASTTLLPGTVSEVVSLKDSYKTKLETAGYTNVSYNVETISGKDAITFMFTYQGHTFTEYFIQYDDTLIADHVAYYTDIVGESIMRSLVLDLYNGIKSPTSTFAGNNFDEKPGVTAPSISDLTE